MELTNEFEVAVPVAEAWKVLTDVERIAPCLPGAQLQEVEGDEYRGIVRVKVGPITASYKGAARFAELDETAHRAVLKAEGRETRGQGNASATITATLTELSGSTKVAVVTDLNITGKVAQFGRGVLAEVSGKLLEQFVSNLETTVLSPAETNEKAAENSGDTPAKAAAKKASRQPAKRASSPAESSSGESGAAGGAGEAPAATETAEDDSSGAEAASGNAAPSASTARRIDSPEVEPVDLVDVAGPSLRKRLLPYASIAGAIFLLRIVVYALRRRKK